MMSNMCRAYKHLFKLLIIKLFKGKYKLTLKHTGIDVININDCIIYKIESPFGEDKLTPIKFIQSAYYANLSETEKKAFIEPTLEAYETIPKKQFKAYHDKFNRFKIVCLKSDDIITIDHAKNILNDFDIIKNLDHESYQLLKSSHEKQIPLKIIK